MKIIVIEDNESDVILIKKALEESKNDLDDIKVFSDGEIALPYIFENNKKIKIVLLDLNLPKIKGDEILKRIRLNEETRYLPVVMFTTSSNPDDVKKTYLLGTNSFVTKPMGLRKFKSAIKNIYDFWIKYNKTPNE